MLMYECVGFVDEPTFRAPYKFHELHALMLLQEVRRMRRGNTGEKGRDEAEEEAEEEVMITETPFVVYLLKP